jgi:hypothetical protein
MIEMRVKLALAALLLLAGAGARAAEPVQVMVLGTYHFANPGLDLNNAKVDTPLTPARQAELERVAAAIAEFRPTRVMVEMQGKGPGLDIAEYQRFGPEMLAKDPNEIVQLGYRIAHKAGLPSVQGVDEQPGPGEPDYFPYDKLETEATRRGQQQILVPFLDGVKPFLREFETAQKTSSVAELLAMMNAPGTPNTDMKSYYSVLPAGDFDSQPGAELNAMWYLRNAKIFGKLMQIAKPGDRIVLVYGAGHGYWLRHLAREAPGYQLVDPLPYLARAER